MRTWVWKYWCHIMAIYIWCRDDMRKWFLWWWLRSTTGPYGWPMTEVAYGEMLFSLHRGCMGVDSSGRVVGVSTWCRRCWTYPGQHQCGLTVYCFLDFHILKTNYIYIWFFKVIHCIKEHWWSLTLSWPDEVQRIFPTAHCLFIINV